MTSKRKLKLQEIKMDKFMLIKLVLMISVMMVQGQEIKIEPVSETLSTFKKEALVVNNLEFSHVVAKIELKKIEERLEELIKLQDKLETMPLPQDPKAVSHGSIERKQGIVKIKKWSVSKNFI